MPDEEKKAIEWLDSDIVSLESALPEHVQPFSEM